MPFNFVLPYLIVFVMIVAYPVVAGLWLARSPQLVQDLLSDPKYLRSIPQTILFVGLAVNIKLILALTVSGLFLLRRWWMSIGFIVFMLPWAIPNVPALLSIRFMLDGRWGLLNTLLESVKWGPAYPWLTDPTLAMASAIGSHIWVWLPFWTMMLMAARTGIPTELYEAASVDGAGLFRQFRNVTWPSILPVYVTTLVLSTIWTFGDYNSIHFITGGGPANRTQTFATLGIHYAFEMGDIKKGIAVAVSAIPVLVPLVWLLVRRFRRQGL